MVRISLVALCILAMHAAVAQEQLPIADLSQVLEAHITIPENDEEYDDAYEGLYQYYIQPLDVNAATGEELGQLHILSPDQIRTLIAHRTINGPLISIYELQAIYGFDVQTITNVKPFLIVSNNTHNWRGSNLASHLRSAQSHILLRAESLLNEKAGYKEGKYSGSPIKYYTRFKTQIKNKIAIGFTLEKDAGEPWLDPSSRPIKLPDYSSFFIKIQTSNFVKDIIVGDFQLQFGQGLTFGSGMRFGKGSEPVLTVKKNNLGIRPHTSVNEQSFFHGVATTMQFVKQVDATIFVSSSKVDGNLVTDTLDSNSLYITSLQQSGYHRTVSELKNKNNTIQTAMGGNLSQKLFHQKLHWGLNFMHSHFDHAILPTPAIYNQYIFHGFSNHTMSTDYNLTIQNINVFGEFGISKSGGQGYLVGVAAALARQLDVAILWRDYARNFHSLAGQAFGENSVNTNESGLYTGIKFKSSQKWDFNFYVDRYKFPWLKYLVDAPSAGSENLLKIQYKPDKKTNLYILLRQKYKEQNPPADWITSAMVVRRHENFVFQLDYTSHHFTIKSRLQGSKLNFQNHRSYGYFAMQEASFNILNFKIGCRYAMFDTDNYDTRQYSFEKSVLHAIAIPAFAGKGTRFYFTLSKNLTKWMAFDFKYAQTIYEGISTIGSGLEQINGNKVRSINLQLRFNFD